MQICIFCTWNIRDHWHIFAILSLFYLMFRGTIDASAMPQIFFCHVRRISHAYWSNEIWSCKLIPPQSFISMIIHDICEVERKVPKYENHKFRERKVKTYQELKRSPKDRHTQTHGNCIEIFRQARPSFSIGRE